MTVFRPGFAIIEDKKSVLNTQNTCCTLFDASIVGPACPLLIDLPQRASFVKQEEGKISDQENHRPDDCPSEPGHLILEVHEIPGDAISLNQGQDQEDPVQQARSKHIRQVERSGLINPQ